ncbi:MAG: UDP-3-O-(3-hydroxymyristoyl)glucosamine N-acyltransferase [Thermodesulfobacteriota bacterium]|nr:UDP-3-O-(3-hydroxymyristoyl)glucosamine N-acyltransferase [Thermodesulfobacteriota bacterium]
MKLSEIADHLGGELLGRDVEVLDVSTIEDASSSDLTFLANPGYTQKALKTSAGAILTREPLDTHVPQVIVGDPYLGFAEILRVMYPEKTHEPGIARGAWVHPEAEIDEAATIYPNAYISSNALISRGCAISPGCFIGERVKIGEGTVLNPNVVVYDGCCIGAHCIIHAGVVIGADGFGFAWDGVSHKKIPQKGTVCIGDYVEIGSNCTIDRAVLTSTCIGNDVKMDDMVHVAHNVTIGDHTLIAAQTGIAGSTHIGKSVTLAGQCGVIGHVNVGDGSVASSRTGIASDVKPGKVVSGYPQMDHRQWLRIQKVYKDLPELLRRVRALEGKMGDADTD